MQIDDQAFNRGVNKRLGEERKVKSLHPHQLLHKGTRNGGQPRSPHCPVRQHLDELPGRRSKKDASRNERE